MLQRQSESMQRSREDVQTLAKSVNALQERVGRTEEAMQRQIHGDDEGEAGEWREYDDDMGEGEGQDGYNRWHRYQGARGQYDEETYE